MGINLSEEPMKAYLSDGKRVFNQIHISLAPLFARPPTYIQTSPRCLLRRVSRTVYKCICHSEKKERFRMRDGCSVRNATQPPRV